MILPKQETFWLFLTMFFKLKMKTIRHVAVMGTFNHRVWVKI